MGEKADLEARIAALEARVTELEDERAIRELLSRYGYTADTYKDEAFADLYTEDATMKLCIRKDVSVWKGKAAILRFITNPTGHHDPAMHGKSMHLNDNQVTHIDGDKAVANSYQWTFAQDENGANRVMSAGNNQWQLRKIDGKWFIKERRGAYLGDQFFTVNLDATPS